MQRDVVFCGPEDTLAEAAGMMKRRNCGAVPVIDGDGTIVGMITDRDICLALADDPAAGKSRASGLTGGKIVSCRKRDNVRKVLRLMSKHQVRRVVVTDKKEGMAGIISIADLLRARLDKSLRKKLASALRRIAEDRPIVLEEIDEG